MNSDLQPKPKTDKPVLGFVVSLAVLAVSLTSLAALSKSRFVTFAWDASETHGTTTEVWMTKDGRNLTFVTNAPGNSVTIPNDFTVQSYRLRTRFDYVTARNGVTSTNSIFSGWQRILR